ASDADEITVVVLACPWVEPVCATIAASATGSAAAAPARADCGLACERATAPPRERPVDKAARPIHFNWANFMDESTPWVRASTDAETAPAWMVGNVVLASAASRVAAKSGCGIDSAKN